MKETVYLETTVVSYYTSKPSRDIIALAHQEITPLLGSWELVIVVIHINMKATN